ncbi:hypothetical protein [Aequorivita capsosiphonis]|uniref:hypothetical protein n=1 Tax=Aequorivita capsosiphonis TaxID=487317 RepID=UPI00042A3D5A|nr:hypothetical protein [Aequorivita capsosiphonis]
MTERVKLIWDFRGPNAQHIAVHHAKHLGEYVATEKLQNTIIGDEELSPVHHTAFLVVEKSLMDSLRETLKPTRGQLYD